MTMQWTRLAPAAVAAALIGLAAPQAFADQQPAASAQSRAEARQAASAPATLDTLSRFFARDGKVALKAAAPHIEGDTVPVYTLSPAFVAGTAGAPVAQLEYLASTAVSSDGQKASLWTVRQGSAWQVVNIATGDDEARYAAAGAAKLPGGTVFQEPQINAWYVEKGTRVLPLDEDAVKAIGANGTTLAAYRARVSHAYGDKLPGSAYDRSGKAGGYAETPQETRAQAAQAAAVAAGHDDGPLTVVSTVAGAGAILALGLTGTAALRRRRRPSGQV
ncbi:hypothetical protein DT019_07605 [Streptomyces sp. SDr-06]|uniref:hypothetical protein n=1 Tax=Streptomyces sp. SDr-06 TaxID=2267702 RepID=UPI000DEA986D|nr:hypothetical protein [Streptomyces sp. SDr-06]RCH69735.1 hypothetical protein DT019_07605 [Streptomyces sp. SDr-06]